MICGEGFAFCFVFLPGKCDFASAKPSWGTKGETKPLFIFYHESKNVCMEGKK